MSLFVSLCLSLFSGWTHCEKRFPFSSPKPLLSTSSPPVWVCPRPGPSQTESPWPLLCTPAALRPGVSLATPSCPRPLSSSASEGLLGKLLAASQGPGALTAATASLVPCILSLISERAAAFPGDQSVYRPSRLFGEARFMGLSCSKYTCLVRIHFCLFTSAQGIPHCSHSRFKYSYSTSSSLPFSQRGLNPSGTFHKKRL